jgi:hypothetical protein
VAVTANTGGTSGGGSTVVVNYSPTYSSATPSEARAFVQSITPALTRELRRQGVL